ncbi:MAG: hypothetical protein NPMRTH1_1550023 [Nitrosopumilales archaeon]|nr:MAG: hypothetical protein NPMRTH1_1550023 [Nitrosopumilales archaeon]
MKKLTPAEITAKSVEISKCFTGFSTHNLASYYLSNTTATGDAARLAVCMRNNNEILTEENLAGICTGIKVDYRLAISQTIPLFEDLGWLKVKKIGRKLDKILETLPPTEDILTTLGKNWEENGPTEVEAGSLSALSELSVRPYSSDAIQSELNISNENFGTMLDYGEQARYFGRFTSMENQKETVWTPLYWAKNPEKVESFLAKQTEQNLQKIGELVTKIKEYPGIPIDFIEKDDVKYVNSGIYHGFFPSIRISNRSQVSHDYIFSARPQFDVNKDADIFEKARMIVGCIRHGQYHAEITKIKYPRSILNALRNDHMGAHSYADVQYAILALNRIVRFETEGSGFIKVRWIDSPENNLAADVADLLFQQQEVLATTEEELHVQKVLVQGIYNSSSEQRRLTLAEDISAKDEFNKLMEILSGVRL